MINIIIQYPTQHMFNSTTYFGNIISSKALEIIQEHQDNLFSPWFKYILSTSALIAVLSMIIIQLIKVPMRGYFHKVKIYTWLEESNKSIYPLKFLFEFGSYFKIRRILFSSFQNKTDHNRSIRKLIQLSTAGNAKAFFQLPINQLCGQISAAQQILLNEAKENQSIIKSLAGNVFDNIGSNIETLSKEKTLEEKLNDFFKKGKSTQQERMPFKKKKELFQLALDSRNRIDSAIQRNIDSLQISASIEWKAWLKFFATIISALFFITGIALTSSSMDVFSFFFLTIIIALAAGYMSSIFRDIIAIIEKLRG